MTGDGMDIAENRARAFVGVFAVAATLGFFLYGKFSAADRLVSLDEGIREAALLEVPGMSAAGRAGLAPALARALKDRDPRVRYRAAAALGALGPSAAAAGPALLEALGDEGLDSGVGVAAGEAYAGVSPEPLPGLLAALKEGSPEARRNAACSLFFLGARARGAGPALRAAAADGDKALADCAARALAAAGLK